MREISVFDVIGPNMIGPSSSHTAGALRIALMARRIIEGRITKVTFILYGSFARTYQGHGTDRALLGGIMGFSTEDKRIKDSFRLADQKGIQYEFVPDTVTAGVYPNTVEIIATSEDGRKVDIVGESIGGGNARLVRINGIKVDISGQLQTLVIMQKDVPGVIAHVSQCCYEAGVNIAFLNMYRENKNETAFSVIQVDGDVSDKLVEAIRPQPNILQVNLIKL